MLHICGVKSWSHHRKLDYQRHTSRFSWGILGSQFRSFCMIFGSISEHPEHKIHGAKHSPLFIHLRGCTQLQLEVLTAVHIRCWGAVQMGIFTDGNGNCWGYRRRSKHSLIPYFLKSGECFAPHLSFPYEKWVPQVQLCSWKFESWRFLWCLDLVVAS